MLMNVRYNPRAFLLSAGLRETLVSRVAKLSLIHMEVGVLMVVEPFLGRTTLRLTGLRRISHGGSQSPWCMRSWHGGLLYSCHTPLGFLNLFQCLLRPMGLQTEHPRSWSTSLRRTLICGPASLSKNSI